MRPFLILDCWKYQTKWLDEVSPLQEREFISSLWHFLEGRCTKKSFSMHMSCATSSQCWLYYLPLIQSFCSVCYTGSIQAYRKQNPARTRIHAFSKGFFNLKHPSFHPHILLLDCFPTEQLTSMLACVPACGFTCMQAICILKPHHGIIFFMLATAAQLILLGSYTYIETSVLFHWAGMRLLTGDRKMGPLESTCSGPLLRTGPS